MAMDLNSLSTPKLRNRLDSIRRQLFDYTDRSDEELSSLKQSFEEIKKVLATREHYPRGKKGRQLRQQAKQNR